jgi:hypothetical protein
MVAVVGFGWVSVGMLMLRSRMLKNLPRLEDDRQAPPKCFALVVTNIYT